MREVAKRAQDDLPSYRCFQGRAFSRSRLLRGGGRGGEQQAITGVCRLAIHIGIFMLGFAFFSVGNPPLSTKPKRAQLPKRREELNDTLERRRDTSTGGRGGGLSAIVEKKTSVLGNVWYT